MEDQELIDRIKHDDRDCFDLLFKKYYRPLVLYIRSLSKDMDLAEDIVQDVFFNLWSKRSKITIKKTVKGYLFWISYTSYIDHYRKSKHRSNLFNDIKEKAFRDALPEDTEVMELKIKKLKSVIESLPPNCKKVLELNKMGGLKYDEIALTLNISKKTVESHMRTAFEKIRQGFDNDPLILMLIRPWCFQF